MRAPGHLATWRRRAGLVVAGVAAASLVACSSPPWNRTRFDVELEGIEERALRRDLLSLSGAWQSRTDPEVDTATLDRAFRADAFNMERYLHAKGYQDARVQARTRTDGRKPVLAFEVTQTNRYTLSGLRIDFADAAPEGFLAPTNARAGAPLDYAAVDMAGRLAVRRLRNAGHPRARVEEKKVIVDRVNQTAEAVVQVRAGAPASFGPLQVEGLRRVDRAFVDRRVTWKPGEPFRQDALDWFSRSLTESALFSFVDISGPAAASTSDVYDVSVRLQERRRRTIGLGVGYQSDTGPEVTTFWQHRNLAGMGERLEFDATYGEDAWLGSLVLTLPDIWSSGNDLDLGVAVADEDSDAYEVRYEKVYARVRQRIGRNWQWYYGPALRVSTVTQRGEEEDYLQVSLPVSVLWNKRNDGLDPTRGFAVSASGEPFYDLDSSDAFVKTLVTPAVYVPLVGEELSAGVRVTLGSISGTGVDRIPADQRFYAGGGQSIRGYAYQSVGPREDGQPVGGLSLVESSVELRWRPTHRIGVVAFVDGGSSYEPEISDFSESFQWGAGLGFRYFTGVGPIRLDVGVPVNPREEIDNDFEFYISIGQAF